MSSRLSEILTSLYPKDASELIPEITKIIDQTKRSIDHQETNLLWHKEVALYTIYPDAIRLPNKSAFEALTEHLDYIKDLGCNTVHILPFLESPMIDKGFDISDYYKVRQDLGINDEIRKFTQKARDLKIKVFMDLVLNHISNEHEWFQKAESGDEKYQNYFSVVHQKPKFIKTINKKAAVWAVYEENGKNIEVNIAFPENCGTIPHWREGKNGNIWYYHTYYPQQLDVNWFNPEVFLEFTKILVFWLKMGFNFRLDAIPFVGKEPYKDASGAGQITNQITEALYNICQSVKPDIAFLAESYENIGTVIDYFGSSSKEQTQLAYNFYLCTALWVTLTTLDAEYIWKQLKKTQEIPVHATWLNFLRNHDELSLAYLSEELNTQVNAELLPGGLPFRGKYGISGRTHSLLTDQERFLMAYFLLASIPGSIMIPYGDEIGAINVPFEELSETDKHDSRSINRGRLTKKAMQENQETYQAFQKIIRSHQFLGQYINIWPEKLKVNMLKGEEKQLFLAKYKAGSSELNILINLGPKPVTLELLENFENLTPVAQINSASFNNSKVKLGKYGGLWLQN